MDCPNRSARSAGSSHRAAGCIRVLSEILLEKPRAVSGSVLFCLSRIRMTTFSPKFIAGGDAKSMSIVLSLCIF